MVYLSTLEEWQKQSALLLQARPLTAKVVTKYNIPNLSSSKYQKKLQRKKENADGATKADGGETALVPRGTITLKTYDPASGVVLQFSTDRAADVGRTIAGLGSLSRHMAALPPKSEATDVVMKDASDEVAKAPTTATETKTPSQPTNAGGKKKKKGKK